MGAPKGNKFWEARTKHGRDKIFSTPKILWDSACEYFEWVENNPLWENKVSQYQGVPVDMPVAKMRAMTQEGLYLFLGISKQAWFNYKDNEDFIDIISQIENVIKSQKFAGAAADLLNANIIARDLGLSDKQQTEITGADGSDFAIKVLYE
jgi:hypothetical protein